MSASYEFYTGTYHGEILSQQDFPAYITRADSYLDQMTFGRYADETLEEAVIDKVKMAECAIAEQCYRIELNSVRSSSSSGEVASESVGSHSRTYRSGYESSKQSESEIYSIGRRYLGYTGLLFRGIPCTRHT